jgi:hypothetical protein
VIPDAERMLDGVRLLNVKAVRRIKCYFSANWIPHPTPEDLIA